MLTTKCIHPGILKTLALCGHGSKVLIADGNYPLAEKSGSAEKVYLGLMSGIPSVPEVLEAIHSVVAIERAEVMCPDDGSQPEIFKEFEKELGLELISRTRYEFYDLCRESNVVLAISTGEKRVFSNILITIGCA